MGSPRKNDRGNFQHVKDQFQNAAGQLFEKEHHGRECNNAIFINILFCALCHIQLLFAVCRNLKCCPNDRTVDSVILKTLPTYTSLQKKINDMVSYRRLLQKPERQTRGIRP